MRVSYNTKASEVTIRLSWTETRQFLSQSAAVEAVRAAVREIIGKCDPANVRVEPKRGRSLAECERVYDCAKCGQHKGQQCRNKHGLITSEPHQGRIRALLRAQNQPTAP